MLACNEVLFQVTNLYIPECLLCVLKCLLETFGYARCYLCLELFTQNIQYSVLWNEEVCTVCTVLVPSLLCGKCGLSLLLGMFCDILGTGMH